MSGQKTVTNYLGSYLRSLRHERGLSTYKLGARTGKNPTFFSLVERGKRGINLFDLWRVITELDGDYGHAVRLAVLDAGVPEEVIVG